MNYQLNGGEPHLRPEVPQPRPPAVNRPFNEDDLRWQRQLLTDGVFWQDQYAVPPRPWSWRSEAWCDRIRLEIDADDFELEQPRRGY